MYFALSPVNRIDFIQPSNLSSRARSSTASHDAKMFCNAHKDIGLFYAGASVINAWRVDDYDTFSANLGLENSNFDGARLEAPADLLLLSRNMIDELFEILSS